MKIRGFSLLEIMFMVAIIALLSTIAIPNLLNSRINANQLASTSLLKSLFSAAQSYRFANSVSLPDTIDDVQNPASRYIYLCANTADCRRSGYIFHLGGTGLEADFFIDAVPETYGTTGKRKFCIAADGAIRFIDDGNNTPPNDASACKSWASLP